MEKNSKLLFLAGIIIASMVWAVYPIPGIVLGVVIMILYIIFYFKKDTKKK
ncbi:hypothetical protein [Methanobacterium sp. SMA-27]|uniref:hypothetical protein n=1 Tax=Methanobacterium sp. SMA-27 TaxID=1495336 RepID=UPI000A63323E|nr:hypothetical protein [Methanobacterium sp. SMA-27]